MSHDELFKMLKNMRYFFHILKKLEKREKEKEHQCH